MKFGSCKLRISSRTKESPCLGQGLHTVMPFYLKMLSDQWPLELTDKMLILLPEDEKPGFFMNRLQADICAHMLSESISDPWGMALHADKLWMLHGCSVPVQALSDYQVKDVYALPRWNSLSRCGARSSLPRSASRSSVMEDGSKTGSSSVCWYHLQWGDKANQCCAPCSHSGD